MESVRRRGGHIVLRTDFEGLEVSLQGGGMIGLSDDRHCKATVKFYFCIHFCRRIRRVDFHSGTEATPTDIDGGPSDGAGVRRPWD